MARASVNKLYRTFVRGLVTEASPLTYPEDSSYNELNTILSRKGSRTRRLGINYLANTLTPSLEVTDNSFGQNEFVWKAVAQKADTNFLVVQKGLTIKFFDLSSKVAAESIKSFSIGMDEYVIADASSTDAAREVFQMTSGKGFLFIASRYTEPVVVEYLPDEDDIEVVQLHILIRDFDGLDDGLANDEEPATLSKEHHYNLLNQGWLYGNASSSTFSPVSYDGYSIWDKLANHDPMFFGRPRTTYSRTNPSTGPIQLFKNAIGRYPGNNKQWWVARAEADNPDENIKAGDFLPDVLNKLYSGNNRAPNGHFILDAFTKDRSAVSGVTNIPKEIEKYRPEAVSFFSGRAWYGAGSTVYFSQILDSTGARKAALCYQEADPTAEDISDLIQSDGGVVPIPEANRIRRLLPIANGMLVFAQNGVWFISGGDASFSAVNISVSKVSSLGTKSPLAAIEVDGTIFWWSETGIDALEQASGQFGPIPGKFGNTSISEQTIQSLFNDIPIVCKYHTKVLYDNRNNRLLWLYNNGNTLTGKNEYNTVLLFDLTLQAFFLWEFAEIEGGPVINGFYNNVGEAFASEEDVVIDSLGNVVTDQNDEAVTISLLSETYVPEDVEYLVNIPGQGMAVASLSDSQYVDWSSFDGTGVEFESFIETGYELHADAMRDKQANYVFCHFRQAENSSCTMTVKWDWSNSAGSGKWSRPVEAYRERNRPSESLSDLDAFEVVTSKNKVRGNGKAIQFKFGTAERGKNFELLGWSASFSGNTQP